MTTGEKKLAVTIVVLSLFMPYVAYRAFKMGVREGFNLVRIIGPTVRT